MLIGVLFFMVLSYPWWWFLALFFIPDLSMIGYLVNLKFGAWLYNFFHHKLLAVMLILAGYVLFLNPLSLAGCILLSHSAFDRIFGFGLKYESGFKDTHLGKIGSSEN